VDGEEERPASALGCVNKPQIADCACARAGIWSGNGLRGGGDDDSAVGISDGAEVTVVSAERVGENMEDGVKVVVDAVSFSEYISDLEDNER
jgi:hypothetical protein